MAEAVHNLDTDHKFHCSSESVIEEHFGSIEVTPLKDGRFQIIAEESTKKAVGKRWHSATVFLTLDAGQVAKLRAALA